MVKIKWEFDHFSQAPGWLKLQVQALWSQLLRRGSFRSGVRSGVFRKAGETRRTQAVIEGLLEQRKSFFAVDDGFLVGVLDTFADFDEESEALRGMERRFDRTKE
jgi:hypothetical protein